MAVPMDNKKICSALGSCHDVRRGSQAACREAAAARTHLLRVSGLQPGVFFRIAGGIVADCQQSRRQCRGETGERPKSSRFALGFQPLRGVQGLYYTRAFLSPAPGSPDAEALKGAKTLRHSGT